MLPYAKDAKQMKFEHWDDTITVLEGRAVSQFLNWNHPCQNWAQKFLWVEENWDKKFDFYFSSYISSVCDQLVRDHGWHAQNALSQKVNHPPENSHTPARQAFTVASCFQWFLFCGWAFSKKFCFWPPDVGTVIPFWLLWATKKEKNISVVACTVQEIAVSCGHHTAVWILLLFCSELMSLIRRYDDCVRTCEIPFTKRDEREAEDFGESWSWRKGWPICSFWSHRTRTNPERSKN